MTEPSVTTQCGDCGARFTRANQTRANSALRMHRLKRHQARGDHKATCPECGVEFTSEIDQARADAILLLHRKKAHSIGAVRSSIHWTASEKYTVVNAAAVKLRAGIAIVDAFNSAMMELPEARRRAPFKFASHIKLANRAQKIAATIAPPAPPPPPPEQTPAGAVQTITVEVPVRESVEKTLRNLTTPTLLAEVFGRLFHRLDKLEHALAGHHHSNGNGNGNGHGAVIPPTSTSPLRTPTLTPEPPAKRSPRIAIGGVKRDQFEHVREKLRDQDCELVWVDTDARTPTKYPNVDAVVVSKHIGHGWYDAANEQLGHSRVFKADGITTVVQRCFDFLSRERAAAAHT